jgi:hypothetical protein
VPDQLTHALAGQPLAPAAAQQPVTELGLTILRILVNARWRLEMPPAGELPRYEAGPVAQTGNLVRCREPAAVLDLRLRASARP